MMGFCSAKAYSASESRGTFIAVFMLVECCPNCQPTHSSHNANANSVKLYITLLCTDINETLIKPPPPQKKEEDVKLTTLKLFCP